MAAKHKIRSDGEGKTKVVALTARRVIIEHCKECLAYELNPRECSSPFCALFPFRIWETPQDTADILLYGNIRDENQRMVAGV